MPQCSTNLDDIKVVTNIQSLRETVAHHVCSTCLPTRGWVESRDLHYRSKMRLTEEDNKAPVVIGKVLIDRIDSDNPFQNLSLPKPQRHEP
jgi:hypothetical protein